MRADSRLGAACPAGNVCRAFDRAVQLFGPRTAIVDGSRTLTYTEMGAIADATAAGLRAAGVQAGDRVGLLMPNCLEFIPTLWGLWKAGAAFTQLPARAGVDDLRHYLDTVAASTLIFHERFDGHVAHIRADLRTTTRFVRAGTSEPGTDAVPLSRLVDSGRSAAPPPPPADGDLATVAFTSGTTGRPKAVLLDHARWSYYAIVAGLEIADVRPGEVFAHVAPLTHYSLVFVLPTLMRGGTNVVLPGFDVERLADTVAARGVTATALVPTIVYALLDAGAIGRLGALRTIVYAGSPMVRPRLEEALDRLGPVFVQTYAGSEPGFVTCLRKEEHDPRRPERLTSAGRALFHVDVAIQDRDDRILAPGATGEICARSPGQMLGYWDARRDAEALRDGWVHTGDIGRLDDEGYLYIVDRKKDMIVTGGLNVFPAQVEDVIGEHAGIAQCAVIGIPDPRWGEAVTAFCVRRAGARVEPPDIVELVRARKGSVWAPKVVRFVHALPTNPSGKVDKQALRAPFWDGRERSVN